MSTVNERLRKFIDQKKIDQVEVARRMKITKQRVNGWLTDTSIPMYALAEILDLFPDLDARWLLTGKNESSMIQVIANEPTPPYINECKNPVCAERIKNLSDTVDDLRADKKWLQEELRRREVPPEKHAAGGVEKNRNAG